MVGYRNLYYNNSTGTMHLWSWDSAGKRQEYRVTFEPYLYVETTNTVDVDGMSVFGTRLKKLKFENEYERRRFVERTRHRLFYNLSPEQQFLIELFKDTPIDDVVKNPLRIFYLDIEVYSPDVFPEADQADHPVNIISIFDTEDQKFHVWGLDAFNKAKVKEVLAQNSTFDIDVNDIVFQHCKSERALLDAFLTYWETNLPDVMSGWNIDGYDTPYIINRVNKILGDGQANRLSPVGKLYAKTGAMNMFGRQIVKWTIRGITTLDYLELYPMFAREKPDSLRLGDIATKELKVGKVAYVASDLAKLADTDWDTFVSYNIQDVNLLRLLEKKLKYIQLARFLAAKGFAPIQNALGKIVIISGALAVQGLRSNKILSTAKTDPNNRGEYAGGYVMDPLVGIQRNVITYDANSLYPNTIITLNISQETKLGKVVSRQNGFVTFRTSAGKTVTLSDEKFEAFLGQVKGTISQADVVYTQAFKGIIPEFIDGFYNERVTIKAQLKALDAQMAKMDPKDPQYALLSAQSDQLDMVQGTIKVFLNSIYGNFANPWSPLFDLDSASSITLTGQAVIKQAASIGSAYSRIPGVTVTPVYGDTDSCQYTVSYDIGPLTQGAKATDDGKRVAADITDFLNVEITNWAVNTLKTLDSRLVFKREAICDVAIYLAKKRYILRIVNNEHGTDVDKIKYVGIELARSAFSAECKALTGAVVETLIKTGDIHKTNRELTQAYEKFKSLPVDDVAFRTSLKEISKYEQHADGFSVAGGTVQHAKGAIYYNQMIKTLGLESKYHPITDGNKVKLVYLMPNDYDLTVLCYNETFPVEFGLTVDYSRMFDKVVAPAIDSIYKEIGWTKPSVSMGEAIDLFDFFSSDE